MQSNMTPYWRRAFRRHDPHTLRLARGVDEINVEHWGDAAVMKAVTGKTPDEMTPHDAQVFALFCSSRNAAQEAQAYRLREKRITRWMFVGALVLVTIILCACGGGEATADEIAQHDADLQAMQAAEAHRVKIPAPVNCAASSACR